MLVQMSRGKSKSFLIAVATENENRVRDFKELSVMRLIGSPRPPVCNYRTFILHVVSLRREDDARSNYIL